MKNVLRLTIYQSQTENVRMLNKARGQINRTINYALRKGDDHSSQVHTKVLALVFCAWVEANFSKVIHTPYGFTLDEINQIKQVHQREGLGAGWQKCIELGLRRVSNPGRSSYLPSVRQKLISIVNTYVIAPSQVRNKIAHGQWVIALNQKNTALNNNITEKLRNLNAVDIYVWFKVHEHLSNIVETLIESPNKAFHRDYWKEISTLENFLGTSRNWNLEAKINKLLKKPIKV